LRSLDTQYLNVFVLKLKISPTLLVTPPHVPRKFGAFRAAYYDGCGRASPDSAADAADATERRRRPAEGRRVVAAAPVPVPTPAPVKRACSPAGPTDEDSDASAHRCAEDVPPPLGRSN